MIELYNKVIWYSCPEISNTCYLYIVSLIHTSNTNNSVRISEEHHHRYQLYADKAAKLNLGNIKHFRSLNRLLRSSIEIYWHAIITRHGSWLYSILIFIRRARVLSTVQNSLKICVKIEIAMKGRFMFSEYLKRATLANIMTLVLDNFRKMNINTCSINEQKLIYMSNKTNTKINIC